MKHSNGQRMTAFRETVEAIAAEIALWRTRAEENQPYHGRVARERLPLLMRMQEMLAGADPVEMGGELLRVSLSLHRFQGPTYTSFLSFPKPDRARRYMDGLAAIAVMDGAVLGRDLPRHRDGDRATCATPSRP